MASLEKDPARWTPDGKQLRRKTWEKLAHLLSSDHRSIPIWPDLAEKAGFSTHLKTSRANFMSRVLKNADLQLRVLELQRVEDPLPADFDVREDVIQNLRRNRENAESAGDYNAVNRANELLGKTGAIFSEVIRHVDPFESMTGEELERTIAGFLKDPIVRGMVERAMAQYQDASAEATKH